MIIEVDDKTGKATTYKSMYEFTSAHCKELDEIYKKKFAPKVKLNFWNRKLLEEQLPSGTGKIVCITSHHIVLTSYACVKMEKFTHMTELVNIHILSWILNLGRSK